MRFSWRRRKRDNATNIDLIFLILLFSMFDTVVARSFVGPIRRLQCMTCKAVNGDTTQLDQFRVRQSLPDPWCDMEPIECAPQQDTCVTVSMQVRRVCKKIFGKVFWKFGFNKEEFLKVLKLIFKVKKWIFD